ncbi:hypothetical protein ACF3NS_08545 [Arsenicicoccus cauae]|uniref:Uncharacterized protein n=1 Tax=Arsenicicoccus cauae TaxID=2663847 RepID=A0A6I3IY64_9MICO|nr:hypothetical protein [Arsenicicoccus cauae]MTB71846.1 hypothetical protein [Arsenicicoccus cauae]
MGADALWEVYAAHPWLATFPIERAPRCRHPALSTGGARPATAQEELRSVIRRLLG